MSPVTSDSPGARFSGQGALSFDPAFAVTHLTSRDARLAAVIERVGPFRLEPDGIQNTFEAVAESIVYQQLNGKAAGTIHARVRALFMATAGAAPTDRFAPAALLATDDAALRGAGLSRNKILALRDLAVRTLAGTVPSVDALSRMTDDAIVESLVAVRGVGRWTAEMLLIFRLGRPDVLPVNDYGIRHGFKLVYRKRAMPTPAELARRGESWRPYRTVASWYLWRAVDLHRASPTTIKRNPGVSLAVAKAGPVRK